MTLGASQHAPRRIAGRPGHVSQQGHEPGQQLHHHRKDFVARDSVAKPIGNTCQDMAATRNTSQASSYATIARDCVPTTARDNQDDCQASVSLARHDASSYATRDSLTARQAEYGNISYPF